MNDKKKPFKETRVGKFLATKAPQIIDAVGDLIPDAGLLGIVANAVNRNTHISDEDKFEFAKLKAETEKELGILAIEDRKSARLRETDFVKALGHVDWMMYFVGCIVMLSFLFLQFALIQLHIPEDNRDMFIHLMGMVDTSVGLVIGYYFGSSHDKTKIVKG